MEKLTAVYCRVASKNREDKRKGIEAQKSRLFRYARKRNPIAVRFYTDAGYSGNDEKRPGLKRLIRDIKKGKVSSILVSSLSRITRSARQYADLMVFFQKQDVSFQSLDRPQLSLKS